MDAEFEPSRAAGLARLAAFTPLMGRDYAERRNYESGGVSRLSPYLRRRLVLEREAVAAALGAHGGMARRFTEEVFWRGYWKGWLEQHPDAWRNYRRDLGAARSRLTGDAALEARYRAAVEGRTGIGCFDAWAGELVSRNWLHNHARMWFASIWIFTLRLPWVLGADFFLHHLLDGDPASNTLSWRWVGGLHTSGKPYVATAENIARFTEGRFDPRGELDEHPEPLPPEPAPTLVPLRFRPMPAGEVALLLHEEDCEAETLGFAAVRRLGLLAAEQDRAPAPAAFAAGALRDAARRAARAFGCEIEAVDAVSLGAWARDAGLPVVTAYAPMGPVADRLAEADAAVHRVAREWDRALWPHASRGFFALRKRMEEVLRV